ncbi:response regulator [Piscibacillus sp. B03]|uniref:response regulator n=1 Tax=Piscibacillus sp. B03 TaxID=3457430 RepID=UPI003FCC5ACF
MIKVFLVDDHEVVRKGLIYFLSTKNDIDIVGEASNGLEALSLLEENKVDVCVLDIQMPMLDGIDTIKEIKHKYPDIQILVLTSFSNDEYVITAIQHGANGYLLKDSDPEKLHLAIRKVYQKEEMIDEKAAIHLLKHIKKQPSATLEQEKLNSLTKRETDVLKEIVKGHSNKEIAHNLFITEKTVKTHISNILSKLDVHDRTQAALLAFKHLNND